MAVNNLSGSRRAHATSAGGKPFRNFPLDELSLRKARIAIRTNSKVILGRVSAVLTGPTHRAIRLTFLPKSSKASHGIEAIEFELPKVEAWALAEWITDQATTRSPERRTK